MKKNKNKSLTIAQRAGYARRKLKNRGIETLKDYKGQEVPLDWIPDVDLVEHFHTLKILDEALELRKQLRAFKAKVQGDGDDIYNQILADNGVKDKEVKNFSLSMLNKNRRIVYKRPPKYTKDEKQLAISRDYKRKFFDDMTGGSIPSWAIDLIEELIEDSRGDIDQGKISKLNQMAQKIKNKNFQKMVKHFNQALDAYYAKRYEQFYLRDEQGEEKSIILTYAKLKPLDLGEGD